jgi:8-oxo-dGTP pyrophosphatase MutT (NUDIX family)
LSEIAYARPSSTVVLARPGADEPELFMVRRHENSSFGAAYAFPGGVVDPEDRLIHEYCEGLSAEEANARLGVPHEALDFYSAAIRELFEESGVLLADVLCVNESLDAVRDGLNDGSDNWADFIVRNDLRLNCGALHYFSHWVTPPSLEKRYSTRFFLAAMPAGQAATHCGTELIDSRWSTAKRMLEAGRIGDVHLHFPTIKTLETIARHKSFEALMKWAQECIAWGVTTMAPVIVERDGRPEILLPGDKDYPGAAS